jgi:hypothetical protein
MIGISKEAQLSRSPGGNRKKKEQTNAEKGSSFEKSVQSNFQSTSKQKVKRNHQGRTGGGLSAPDVSIMHQWHCEAKHTERLELPKWIDKLAEDCPRDHKPALVFNYKETPWIAIRLADRMNFAADQIEAAGGIVSFE